MSRLHGSGRLEGVMTLSGANSPPTTCTLPLPQIHRQPTFFKKTNRNLNGTNPNPPASAAANTTDERQPATVSGCGCASALFFYFFFTKNLTSPSLPILDGGPPANAYSGLHGEPTNAARRRFRAHHGAPTSDVTTCQRVNTASVSACQRHPSTACQRHLPAITDASRQAAVGRGPIAHANKCVCVHVTTEAKTPIYTTDSSTVNVLNQPVPPPSCPGRRVQRFRIHP